MSRRQQRKKNPGHLPNLPGYWFKKARRHLPANQEATRLAAECRVLREQSQALRVELVSALAERDGLRRELEWVLRDPKAARPRFFKLRIFRGLQRRKYRFVLMAVHDLVPLRSELHSWEATGEDPQFSMLPIMAGYPSGWVLLNSAVPHAVEGYQRTKLYLDLGEGFKEDTALDIPISLSGRIVELIRLPKGVKAMRWDPVDAAGRLHQEQLVMTELGFLERMVRMYWRSVRMLRSKSKQSLDSTGLSWGKLFRQPAEAYRLAGLLKGRTDQIAPTYADWIRRHEALSDQDISEMRKALRLLRRKPLISVVMPTYNTPEPYLRAAIDSVLGQVYDDWELCIADDASTQPNVRQVLREYAKRDDRIKLVLRENNGHISAASNSALAVASGDFVALMDHDDLLPPHALYEVVKVLNANPDAKIVYSDEDKIDATGNRSDPHFKPDWNPELLRSQNYISHLGVYESSLVRRVGGFRLGYEGSQDYDLLLRCVARCNGDEIVHIPKILYHWRILPGSTAFAADEKSYTQQAGIKALQDHLSVLGIKAAVGPGLAPNTYRVKYPIPKPHPLVSLLIPTRDRLELVRTCVESILQKTRYRRYEILILDNQSEELATLSWFEVIQKNARVRVISYDHPFNFSAINNFGVAHAKGEIIGLINNDIEVISRDWLTEMVSHACRPEIGCVGAKLYYDNDTVQHAGIILGIGGVAGHAHKRFPKQAHGYFSRMSLVQNLSAVTAACLIVRRDIYEAVGGLNEKDLKVAFNDVDFCLKVKEAGYLNLWTPYAELYHHESISRGAEDTPEKQARFTQEVKYMKQRWGDVLRHDPAYNTNLTMSHEDFSIA